MSSTNKSKYLSHVNSLCIAQLLRQVGIDKCSRNALQLMSDIFACYLGHVSNIISLSSTILTHRSNPSSCTLIDGILVLEQEIGPYSTRSSNWNDFFLFVERQISLSKLFSKLAEGRNICLLNILAGLPMKLDIEGKETVVLPKEIVDQMIIDDEEEEDYSFLPPKPLIRQAEQEKEKIEVNLPIPIIEIIPEPNLTNWKEETIVLPFEDNFLSVESQIDLNTTPSLGLLKEESHPQIFEERFATRQIDLIALGLQNIFRSQLWISNEPQVLSFFSPNRQFHSSPIVLSTSNPSSTTSEIPPPQQIQLQQEQSSLANDSSLFS